MALILVSFAHGSWPTWGGDNANTGQQTLRGAMAEAPTVKRGLAWANSIEWQFSAISNADGDGKLDVLLASPALYPYALNGPDGSQLWAFQAISGFLTPPSVADLNGVPEVVVGSFDSLVYCLHGPSGSLRWKLNLATDPHSPFSGDVDGDGCSEVVMGTNGSDAAERFLFVLDDRGGATLCGTAVLFRGWLPAGEHRFSSALKRGAYLALARTRGRVKSTKLIVN